MLAAVLSTRLSAAIVAALPVLPSLALSRATKGPTRTWRERGTADGERGREGRNSVEGSEVGRKRLTLGRDGQGNLTGNEEQKAGRDTFRWRFLKNITFVLGEHNAFPCPI